MKRKWTIIGIVGAVIAISLIVGNLVGRDSIPSQVPVVPEIPLDREERYLDSPVGESFSVNSGVVMDKAIAPAVYEFGSVIPGAIVDTWTVNGYVPVGGDWVSYKAGEQLWMLVYNGLDSKVTYNLKCVSLLEDTTHCDLTGQDYSGTPEGALVGITFPSTVTIEPMSAMKIPLSINYPMGVEYPNQWEFRISVFDLKVWEMVETGLEFRLFTYMR